MQQQPSSRDHIWLRCYLETKAISNSNIDLCIEKLVHQEGFGRAETFKHVPPSDINRKYLQSLGITGLGTQQAIIDLHTNLQDTFATPFVHDLTEILEDKPILKESTVLLPTSKETSRPTTQGKNLRISSTTDPDPGAPRTSHKVNWREKSTTNQIHAPSAAPAGQANITTRNDFSHTQWQLRHALPTARAPPKYGNSFPTHRFAAATTFNASSTTDSAPVITPTSTINTSTRAASPLAQPTFLPASAPTRASKYDRADTPLPPADLPRKFRKTNTGEKMVCNPETSSK